MERDRRGAPVLTTNEARQGQRTGVVWILTASTILAAIAGIGFWIYWG